MPASNDTTVVVNIYGKNYVLALEPGQTAEHVRECARLVDAAMSGVQDAHHTPKPVFAAILAGLNLVEELFQLQREFDAAELDIETRASRLTESLGRLFDTNRVDALSPDHS